MFKRGSRVAIKPEVLACHDVRATCPWGIVLKSKEWPHGEEVHIGLDDGTLAVLPAQDITLQVTH